MEADYYQVKEWRRAKEKQVKNLKTRLFNAEQELSNLIEAENKKKAVEEAYFIANA